MTVLELISLLHTFPEDAVVVDSMYKEFEQVIGATYESKQLVKIE